MHKINFEYNQEELTAYFSTTPGGVETPCYYCEQPGFKQYIKVEEIILENNNNVSLRSSLGRCISKYIKRKLLNKRAVCGSCSEKFVAEKFANLPW